MLISVSVMFEKLMYYSVCVYHIPRLFFVKITKYNVMFFLKFLQKAAGFGCCFQGMSFDSPMCA